MKFFTLLFLTFAFAVNCQNYKVAAIDFVVPEWPRRRILPPRRVDYIKETNFNELASYVHQAKIQGADIFVSPEYVAGWGEVRRIVWYQYTEDYPEISNCNPCLEQCGSFDFTDSPILKKASCLARNESIYLVYNAANENKKCWKRFDKDCPPIRHYLYNTAVVFDRDGNIVSRYRKEHLFSEGFIDSYTGQDLAYFETDFGVKFGVVICFDSIFTNPIQTYKEMGIENILVPTYADVFTIMGSWSAFNGIARSKSVNMVVSGIGDFAMYTSGTVITNSGNIIDYYYNPTEIPQTQMIVADVPYNTTPVNLQYEEVNVPQIDPQPIVFETVLAEPGQTYNLNGKVNDFYCEVNFTVDSLQDSGHVGEYFTLFVYDGSDFFNYPSTICSFVNCKPDPYEEMPCDLGYNYWSDTYFTDIKIRANTVENSNSTVNVINGNMWEKIDDDVEYGKNYIESLTGFREKILSATILEFPE